MRLVSWTMIVCVAAAGCGDDLSLRVDVDHAVPPSTTTISVYESATLTCEAVEFADVSASELSGLLVAELTIDAMGRQTGSLDGLSRTDHKVIVARGYDRDGQLLTGGCVEHDTIGGNDQVTITTTRASIASIGQLAVDSTVDPFGLPVTLTDARGAALPRNRLSWRVYAPSGATAAASPSTLTSPETGVWQLAEPTCTNVEGGRRVHPVPPSTVGGFAIQIRPSWPIVTPPMITGFTRIDPGVTEVFSSARLPHPCAIRIGAGTLRRIVCVEKRTAGALDTDLVVRQYRTTVTNGDVTVTQDGAAPSIDAGVIAVYAVASNGLQDVYAVTATGQVINTQTPQAPSSPWLPGGEPAADALATPACGGKPPTLVMRTDAGTGQRLVVMPATGGAPVMFHDDASPTAVLTLRAAGCMTELDPDGLAQPRQAVVVDHVTPMAMSSRRVTTAHFECVGASPACSVDLPVPSAGAGFTTGADPLLAGTSLDASGVVVSQWAVLKETDVGYRRVELGRVAAASVPRHIVYGNFDDDGLPDAFWDIAGGDVTESTLQATYARLAGTTQLSAVAIAQPIAVTDMLVGDVTGDDADDIVLIGIANLKVGIAVIPTRVPAAAPGILRGDDPCP